MLGRRGSLHCKFLAAYGGRGPFLLCHWLGLGLHLLLWGWQMLMCTRPGWCYRVESALFPALFFVGTAAPRLLAFCAPYAARGLYPRSMFGFRCSYWITYSAGSLAGKHLARAVQTQAPWPLQVHDREGVGCWLSCDTGCGTRVGGTGDVRRGFTPQLVERSLLSLQLCIEVQGSQSAMTCCMRSSHA